MKTKNHIILKLSTVLMLLCGVTSCTNTDNSSDTKEVADQKNEAKFETKKSERDARFLVNAAEVSRREISLGQLAQTKSNLSHVKELGKLMETEHVKSLGALTTLAKSKNISLPTSLTERGQETYNKLNDKTGNDFGKAYADEMVKEHKSTIDLFEDAAENADDTDIKNWARASLPTLRKHLEHSLACQEECSNLESSNNSKYDQH